MGITIHILAAVAEHEREMISARTKAALAAAKARGRRLGGPAPAAAGVVGQIEQQRRVSGRATAILPIIAEIQRSGVRTYRGIASVLNARGISAPRGGVWYAAGVRRYLGRQERPAMTEDAAPIGGSI